MLNAKLPEAKLITGGQQQPIPLNPFLLNNLALFDDGTIYVVRGQEASSRIVSFIEGQKKLGTVIKNITPVSYSQLKDVYAASGESMTQAAAPQHQLAAKQGELLHLVRRAAALGASDIHLTLWPARLAVEFRVNGLLEQAGDMSHEQGRALMIAAFNMADISGVSHQMTNFQEARLSRLSVDLPGALQALRMQFNPLVFGGRLLVLRLLYASKTKNMNSLAALGWNREHQIMLKRARKTISGMIIIAGPTGAGKSTTLKTMLDILKREDETNGAKMRHILTVEDPPEYMLDDVHQMPVPESDAPEGRQREFARAINAALRSDPDTIAIGEIRDAATASLAFAAVMSGHQVWTTLHASSAAAIIPRLRDIGVEHYKLADEENITALIAQRLVRVLCPHCRVPISEAGANAASLHPAYARFSSGQIPAALNTAHISAQGVFLAGKGCSKCRAGYAGRTSIGEIILPDSHFLALAAKGQNAAAREYWKKECRGRDYKEDALHKMHNGIIDPLEYDRWCGGLL